MDIEKCTTRRLAIFDFDGTMVKGDSIVSYIAFARKKGYLNLADLLSVLWATVSYALRLVPIQKSKSASLRFLKRVTKEQKQDLAEEFIHTRVMPRLYPRAFKKIIMHEGQGDIVLIVSASPAVYMHGLANFLPVHAVLASPTEDDGTVRINCRGEQKVLRVKQWLKDNGIEPDWKNSYSYGDSLSDAQVMALTGHPTMINPKKALAAKQSSWAVEDWAGKTVQ